MKNILKQTQFKVRKVLPFIDVNLLEIVKKNKVKGVYGYLIDFVSIHQDLTYNYEMTGLTKLCSLLVED